MYEKVAGDNRVHAGQVVYLCKEWIAFAQYLAKKRYFNNRIEGLIDMKIGKQSTWQTDYYGICAEIAFCKLCNLFPDAEIRPQAGTWDCSLPEGHKVDVKSTVYPNGRLLATLKKRAGTSDELIYVLMIGEPPKFRFAGWAWAGELLREENIINLGHGPGYGMEQADLHQCLEF